MDLRFGDLHVSHRLGDDPKYKAGRTSAKITSTFRNELGRSIGTMTMSVSWNVSQVTITVTGTTKDAWLADWSGIVASRFSGLPSWTGDISLDGSLIFGVNQLDLTPVRGNASFLTKEVWGKDQEWHLVTKASVKGGSGGLLVTNLDFRDLGGPTVQVSAIATNPLGGALHYRWRTTDGEITDQDAATTTWRLPSGKGLHFAYVLVSNGKGGYTERRVAVNTDVIGWPGSEILKLEVRPPLSSKPQGNTVYSMVGDDGEALFPATVYLADVSGQKPWVPGTLDLRGFATFYNVPAGDWMFPCEMFDGPSFVQTNCNGAGTEDHKFTLTDLSFAGLGWAHFTAERNPPPAFFEIRNTLYLRDGNLPGVNNEFFGIASTPVATLLTTNGTASQWTTPARTSSGRMNFYFPDGLPPGLSADARIGIEGATPVHASGGVAVTNMDSVRPLVTNMRATLNGTNFGLFLPPPADFGPAHDDARKEDVFLTAKGIDSRLSAWKYYEAIGAITSYDAENDRVVGGISFEDWKRQMGMNPYGRNGKTDVTATYINRVDLNLTREHHSISYGSNAVAAYVCNSLGPVSESQTDVNKAIDNAVHGKNLVACVAMDHTITKGVNGGVPFTRFLIFGPNGQLLPSINLDGLGEKFVPGVCVACHGGDHYAGSFPTTGKSSPDVGAHFLPYDTGNFAFSTQAGLTEADQEQAIHQLNLNVLDAGPTPAAKELIAGWYKDGSGKLDKEFVPPSYTGKSSNAIAFYKEFYAKSCRTCHVAMSEPGNFDHYDNLIKKTEPYHNYEGWDRIWFFVPTQPGETTFNAALMPNSLRTFGLLMNETNRLATFWKLYDELWEQSQTP